MITTPQPSPKIPCHQLHIERAQQGYRMCVDCRRPLFPYPKNKCRAHSIYACNECFSVAQIAECAWERGGYYGTRDVEDETPTETQSKKGTKDE